jgi:N4-gp56 family major capsid protein
MTQNTREVTVLGDGSSSTAGKLHVNVTGYYDKVLLDRLNPSLLYGMFGEPHPLPEKEGSRVTMRRYSKLAVATTGLTEGVTPNGSQLSHTDIHAIPVQYGDFVTLTDVVKTQSPDPVRTVAVEILGEQAGESFDILDRNVLIAGTNVRFASGATADTTTITAIELDDVRMAVNYLERNNVKKMKEFVGPSTKVSTAGLDASYICITHPDARADCEGMANFVKVQEYASPGERLPNEIGYVAGCRFLITSQCSIETGTGGDSTFVCVESVTDKTDLYKTIIMGKRAYGITSLGSKGKGVRTYFKDFNEGGTGDPLEQRCTQGWKGWRVAKILDDTRIVRIEHGCTAANVYSGATEFVAQS